MRLFLHMLARIALPAGMVWLTLGLLPSVARVGDTFAKIRATGKVRCGVSAALSGFAQKRGASEVLEAFGVHGSLLIMWCVWSTWGRCPGCLGGPP
jgi:hypothetical protein